MELEAITLPRIVCVVCSFTPTSPVAPLPSPPLHSPPFPILPALCFQFHHACSMEATCSNTDGSYECLCAAGYSGDGLTTGTGCIDVTPPIIVRNTLFYGGVSCLPKTSNGFLDLVLVYFPSLYINRSPKTAAKLSSPLPPPPRRRTLPNVFYMLDVRG